MKISVWNRLWAALAGLIIFLIGINLLVFSIGIVPFKIDLNMLNGPFELWQRIVMVFSALLLCLLGFNGIWMLFRRKGDKGFIMQHTDLGDMSISMHALETMVHKCVDQHQEISVKATRIYRIKNGIGVEIRIILAPGVNIPLTVSALQKQIRQYITSCSGVEVQEVRALVETSVAKQHSGKEQKELVVDARKPVSAPPVNIPVHAEPPVQKPVFTEAVPVATPVQTFHVAEVASDIAEAQGYGFSVETTEEAVAPDGDGELQEPDFDAETPIDEVPKEEHA